MSKVKTAETSSRYTECLKPNTSNNLQTIKFRSIHNTAPIINVNKYARNRYY
jgi:hypothetical protein